MNGVVTIEVGPAGGPASSILTLPVNPDQSLTQDYRVTVQQTWNGIYTDDWGVGVEQIQLNGTTAFSVGQGKFNGAPIDGETAARNLYANCLNYYFQREEKESGTTTMFIYDDVFGRAWQVKPIGQLQLTITNNSPVVFNYSQTFVVLKDLLTGTPTTTTTTDPVKAIWQTTTSVKSKAKSSVSAAKTTAVTVKQTKDIVYVVKSGDTLWTIATEYSSKTATDTQIQNLVNQITSLNSLKNADLIFPGEKLSIPS